MSSNNEKKSATIGLGHRFLHRGEQAVAHFGLALAVIFLGCIGATCWWNIHVQSQNEYETTAANLESLTEVVAQGAESMLADGDLSGLRRMLITVADQSDLSICRVLLPDGRVIADRRTENITALIIPEPWPSGLPPRRVAEKDERAYSDRALSIPGRGAALLELSGANVSTGETLLQNQLGTAVACVIGFLSLLILYRVMRRRFRTLGAIHGAIDAMNNGENSIEALGVSETLGHEATAWNQLLTRVDEWRQSIALQEVTEALSDEKQQGSAIHSAWEALWYGLVIVNRSLDVLYTNGAARMFLNTEESDDGLPHLQHLLKTDDAVAAVQSVFLHRNGGRCCLQINRSEDECDGVLRIGVVPLEFDGDQIAMLVIEDITQQRLADEARHSFVAQATHELRAPLTNIRLYVDTAIEDGDLDPGLRGKCLNVINQEATRLERIVGDMLSVSEMEAGAMQLVLNDVRVETAIHELQSDFEAPARAKGVALRFDLPPKFPVIQGDRDKIMLALHNIISNAIKYTPEGGTIQVLVDQDGNDLRIDVADTGMGIADENLQKVFEKFFRAPDDRVREITGTGLGLPLAREVIRMHGGDVSVTSELNTGTTFTITIPVKLTDAMAA